MGKKDKAYRTKNNARPSSSSRSAELLENQAPTFFGLTPTKSGGVSILAGIPTVTDEIDGSIDVNYQIVLKKMIKKDPVTRVKALKEFAEMCDRAEANEVKAILPFWPRLYSQLCCDTDHRVREVAHQAHKSVVSKVKKSLAPYLKEIIGAWFTSQYDNYPPAATAAEAAFQEAFAPNKMTEAIAFCQDEILEYVIQNLIFHSPQTLCNSKTTSPEDMESKYRRVITSSLLGYTLYLEKMSSEQLTNSLESNKRLLTAPKFWKFANHKDPLIRHSFFTALNSLFQHGSVLLAGETTRASSAILNNLGENDPLVLPVFWNAVLHGLVSLPECWAHPNVEKQLMPKLFNILRSGGDGNACAIFPNVLPLLSQIPEKIIGDKIEFFNKLFQNMKSGLDANSVNRSQSESRIVVETFIECFKYITMLELKNSELVFKILKDHLMTTIRSRLSSPTTQLTTKPFFYHLSQLLRSWHRSGPEYNFIVNIFWVDLGEMLKDNFNEQLCLDDIESNLRSQCDLLRILQTPSIYVPRCGRERVKFAEKTAEETVKVIPNEISAPGFDEACLECSKNLSVFYFEKFKTMGSVLYLKSAMEIAKMFDAFSIFGELIDDIMLLKEDLPPELMVEFNTHMLPHVTEKVQERLLQELSHVPDDSLYHLCRDVLRCPTSIVRNWIQGPEFTTIYIRSLQLFLGAQLGLMAADVLRQFFAVEPLLSADATRQIIEALSSSVNSRKIENAERVMLIATAWPGVLCCSSEFEQFLINLYLACCQTDNEVYNQLFRQMLQKVKYYRAVEPYVWSSLFKAMASCQNMGDDVQIRVNVIAKMVEIAKDVDLTEICDGDEIQEVIPLLTIFLKPSESVLRSKNFVLTLTEMVHEFEGVVDATYWRLKSSNNTCVPHADARRAGWHEDQSSTAVSKAVDDYQQWLLFAGSLIRLIVKAYPVYSRLEDLKHEDRYTIVTTDAESRPASNPNESTIYGIIAQKITIQEHEALKAEKEMLSSLYDVENYPDANLIAHIGSFVLDIFEGYAAVHQLSTSMSFPKSNETDLKRIVTGIITDSTPKEFEYLCVTTHSNLNKRPLWYLLKNIFQELYHFRFKIDEVVNAEAHVNEALSEGWTDSTDRVLTAAANVLDYFSLLTADQWRKIFIETDRVLKAICDNGSDDENQVALSGAFSTLYIHLNHIFKNEIGKGVDVEIHEMWNSIVDISYSTQLLTVWKHFGFAVAHVKGSKEAVYSTNMHLYVPLTVICSAVQCGFLNGSTTIADLDSLTEICASLLLSRLQPMQITAFKFFELHLTRLLVLADTEIFQATLADENDDDDKFTLVRNCEWKLNLIKRALESAQTVVEALLSDLKLGDTCVVQPYTDSFTYAHGYLLIWCILAKACSEAHAALRFQYAQWLKQEGHLSAFLTAVFRLMPAKVVHDEEGRQQSSLFENQSEFHLKQPPVSCWVEERACFVYRMILQTLPAAVRDWCSELDHHVNNIVNHVTRVNVSPLLTAWELKEAQNIGTDLGNLTVSASLPSNELFATYKVDEAVMQIVITLPNNYPLSTVKVDLNSGAHMVRGCRIVLFLTHRNGSLRDALALWKSDLDKKFDGLEECEICFSILQGPNMEIPKQACKTCRKKFHSACLYKWFSTSNKSSCPHCRNLY